MSEYRAAFYGHPPGAAMFVHPQFDPIALQLGPVAVRWYGLMYLVAFLGFFLLGRLRLSRGPHAALTGMNSRDLEDLLFYGAMGVVLGGRLGYVLFYKPAYYLAHPLEIPAVWQGGMAFHGGLLGVIMAIALWSRLRGKRFWPVIDFVAPLVPIGLAAGRLGNFNPLQLDVRVLSSGRCVTSFAARCESIGALGSVVADRR